ncbi:MAG: hypothetical protein ACRD3C_01570 [Vicinamibacterales bacterium]
MKFSLACVIAASLFFVSSAEAQLCGGAPSFAQAPMQVGVSAAFRDGAQGVGGHFAGGGQALFGGVGLGVVNFSDLDATQTNITAFGGADLGVSGTNSVFVCPVAAVRFGVGPDIGPIDVSSVGLHGGGSVGVIASSTPSLMVVPTFGLAAAWQRVTFDTGTTERDVSDTFGIANLGVGFIFNRNVGITPSISIPFSVADSDVVFTLAFAFNF